MIYGSVCSGIEAASVAWHPLGWRAAFVSEIEAFPRAVLAHRWGGVPLHGDFTTIPAGRYGPVDLLVGGTPCQSFSVAGLRGGLTDDRGNLALEFLRLAHRLRPRWLVWENVPGVLSSTSHDAPDPCLPPDDLEEGAEWVGEDEYDADESHALSCFLAGLSELGYGFAYRVLDAQYFGVPQRRRRVFVVGCLGDWRRAVAVLFERHSLSGHPPPSREAGAGVAEGAVSRALSRVGGGDDPGANKGAPLIVLDGGLIPDVSVCLSSHDQSRPESGAVTLIAHALRADGFDASEDGTGRGTPLVPAIAPCLTQNYGKQPDNSDTGAGPMLVAFDTTQITSKANYSKPRPGDPCHPLAAGAHPPAVAFTNRGTETDGAAETLRSASHGALPMVAHGVADASAYEADASSLLSTLRERVGAEAVAEWGSRILDPLQSPEVLRSWLYGESLRLTSEPLRRWVDDCPLPREEGVPARAMREVWENGPDGRTPQGRGLAKQLTYELGEALSKLPYEGPLPPAVVQRMRPAAERARLLREALSAVQEVGRSAGGQIQPAYPGMAVRRLTPRECERLMGLPDDYTLVPYRGKPAADGPRYKALGNSMAVPVMAWIGRRIQMVEELDIREAVA